MKEISGVFKVYSSVAIKDINFFKGIKFNKLMKAYHIKTNEQNDLLFEKFNLDSIYIPKRNILLCFAKLKNMEGILKNYGGRSSRYISQAEKIINGNKDGVKGEIICKRNLEEEVVEKINQIQETVPCPPQGKKIGLVEEFDNSTDCLIRILSGESIKKRKKIRIFSESF